MVTIEPLDARFEAAIQRLASDPAIGATSNVPSPYPPDGAARFVEETARRREAGEEFVFAVLLDGEAVGTCGLIGVHRHAAELGYWIGKPFWGRGAATVAARLVVRFGFETLGLETIGAHCLSRNAASASVLVKAGFRRLGESVLPRSKWPTEPVSIFELSREAWTAEIGPPATGGTSTGLD